MLSMAKCATQIDKGNSIYFKNGIASKGFCEYNLAALNSSLTENIQFVRIKISLFFRKKLLKVNNRKLTRISPNVWKLNNIWASLVPQLVKNLPAMLETLV